MATGKKRNDIAQNMGGSFMDDWNVSSTIAANLSFVRFNDDNGTKAIGWYYGTAAIATTLTALAAAPLGTIIFDLQAHTTVEKTGAAGTSTWVTSAARS